MFTPLTWLKELTVEASSSKPPKIRATFVIDYRVPTSWVNWSEQGISNITVLIFALHRPCHPTTTSSVFFVNSAGTNTPLSCPSASFPQRGFSTTLPFFPWRSRCSFLAELGFTTCLSSTQFIGDYLYVDIASHLCNAFFSATSQGDLLVTC